MSKSPLRRRPRALYGVPSMVLRRAPHSFMGKRLTNWCLGYVAGWNGLSPTECERQHTRVVGQLRHSSMRSRFSNLPFGALMGGHSAGRSDRRNTLRAADISVPARPPEPERYADPAIERMRLWGAQVQRERLARASYAYPGALVIEALDQMWRR